MVELISIKEIADNLEKYPEMAKAINTATESFAKEDRSFDCQDCGERFIPAEDQWIFHNLCNRCFSVFDQQKMQARMAVIKEWLSTTE